MTGALSLIVLIGCAGRSAKDPSTLPAWEGTGLEPARKSELKPAQLTQRGRLVRAKLVREVLERNPSVQAARQAWQATRARRSQRSAWEDPVLSYSVAPLSIGSSKVRFGQAVELSQRVPWPGKLGSLEKAAEAEAQARFEDYMATRLDLALATSHLFDEYYLVERALEINQAHRAVLRQLEQSAEAHYGAGRGSLQDPLAAEIEVADLERQRIALETERQVRIADLNTLLHRAPNAPLPPPPKRIELDTREPAPSAELQQIAQRTRAELRAAAHRIAAAKARGDFADSNYFPDFTLMASYNSMWQEVEHQFMLGIAAPIPLQRGARAGAVEEAKAEALRARAELSQEAAEVRREVEVAREKLVEALKVLQLYQKRLLPLARDRLKAARRGFQTGSNDFSDVVGAEHRLHGIELEFIFSKGEVSKRRAELDRALGRIAGLPNQAVER